MAAGSPSTWDASAAISRCSIQPWTGVVWRCHTRKFAGDDATGSLGTTGRFNRGADTCAANESWPALYTSLALHVALGERLRHTTRESLKSLANQRLSRLRVTLHAVINLCAPGGCAEIDVAGIDLHSLCQPTDYERTHQIAEIARVTVEALLVPSCTRFPEGNLIVFPDHLRPGSILHVEETQDPELFVAWESYA